MKLARQFGLAEAGMDFLVADVVQENDLAPFAPLQLWHKMVQALRHIRRDWPQTQRTDWNRHLASTKLWWHRMAQDKTLARDSRDERSK
jgi:hypothetical protein